MWHDCRPPLDTTIPSLFRYTASRDSSADRCFLRKFILVKATRAGDLGTFDKLVGPYQGKFFHVALRITRNRKEAEDAVQKSLSQTLVHLDTFHGVSKFPT